MNNLYEQSILWHERMDLLKNSYEKIHKSLFVDFDEDLKVLINTNLSKLSEDLLSDNILNLYYSGLGYRGITEKYNITKYKFDQYIGEHKNAFTQDERNSITKLVRKYTILTQKIEIEDSARKELTYEVLQEDYKSLILKDIYKKYKHKYSREIVYNLLIEYNIHKVVNNNLKGEEAKKRLLELGDEYLINYFNEHKNLSVENIALKLSKEDPKLTKKSVLKRMSELNLKHTKEESNELRRISSLNDSRNTDYLIKKNTIDAINRSYENGLDGLIKYINENEVSVRKAALDTIVGDFSIRSIEKMVSQSGKMKKRISSFENDLQYDVNNIFKDYKVIRHDLETIKPKELDFLIPELKIAIEANGDYWHSDTFILFNKGMSSYDYHKMKIEECNKRGYRLLYIWESDYYNNIDLIKELLLNKEFDHPIFHILSKDDSEKNWSTPKAILSYYYKRYKRMGLAVLLDEDAIIINKEVVLIQGREDFNIDKLNYFLTNFNTVITIYPWHDRNKIIEFVDYKLNLKDTQVIYARNLTLKKNKESTKLARNFIRNNHILGYPTSRNFFSEYRLENDSNEILGVAHFVSHKDGVELKRLVFANNHSIVGGASKLINNFKKDYPEIPIYTFSDRNLSEGDVYEKLGFELISTSKGQSHYYHPKTKQHFSELSLIMVGADRLLKNHPNYTPVGIGEDLPSNQEIVESYGFIKYIDCGNHYWKLK